MSVWLEVLIAITCLVVIGRLAPGFIWDLCKVLLGLVGFAVVALAVLAGFATLGARGMGELARIVFGVAVVLGGTVGVYMGLCYLWWVAVKQRDEEVTLWDRLRERWWPRPKDIARMKRRAEHHAERLMFAAMRGPHTADCGGNYHPACPRCRAVLEWDEWRKRFDTPLA